MKKILLLLCILSITIGAMAQTTPEQVNTLKQVSHNMPSGWKEGWYYDIQGDKHPGFIEITYTDLGIFNKKPGYIDFKTTKKEKSIKVLHSELRSIVFPADSGKVDSFVVSTNEIIKNKTFIRVYFTRGNESIYTTRDYKGIGLGIGSLTSMVSGGLALPVDTYYYGNNPNDIIKLSGKRFKETMSKLMADKPWVVKKIKDGTFDRGNMDDLFYYYKTDKLPETMIPPIND